MPRADTPTAAELDAILSIAGDAVAHETAESVTETPEEATALIEAFEAGMEKLRRRLARLEARAVRRPGK